MSSLKSALRKGGAQGSNRSTRSVQLPKDINPSPPDPQPCVAQSQQYNKPPPLIRNGELRCPECYAYWDGVNKGRMNPPILLSQCKGVTGHKPPPLERHGELRCPECYAYWDGVNKGRFSPPVYAKDVKGTRLKEAVGPNDEVTMPPTLGLSAKPPPLIRHGEMRCPECFAYWDGVNKGRMQPPIYAPDKETQERKKRESLQAVEKLYEQTNRNIKEKELSQSLDVDNKKPGDTKAAAKSLENQFKTMQFKHNRFGGELWIDGAKVWSRGEPGV